MVCGHGTWSRAAVPPHPRTLPALSQTSGAFWGIWPLSRLPVEGGCGCLAPLWGPLFPGLLWGPAWGSCWLLELEESLRPHDTASAPSRSSRLLRGLPPWEPDGSCRV